ncbi:GCN5-related N-acetyltransferase [uncultured Paludibacter sp.]|nr:GCN5-related N-acetyltransferase [uncultured Paludibacter sp.]
MNLEYLQWDSDFFDLKIGRIICDKHFRESDLKEELNTAKKDNYSLLYVFTPERKVLTDEFQVLNQGKLVDRKIIYFVDDIEHKTLEKSTEIIDYSRGKLTDELLSLSYLSGQYSRFLLDENLQKNAFERLYKEWIEKSLSGKLADKVFVSLYEDKIVGFVTLKIKENNGEIGLIAVSEQTQGKRIGTKLIDVCIDYLNKKSIKKLTVPTQLNNIPARKFYEKYGFGKLSITNIYHFWI